MNYFRPSDHTHLQCLFLPSLPFLVGLGPPIKIRRNRLKTEKTKNKKTDSVTYIDMENYNEMKTQGGSQVGVGYIPSYAKGKKIGWASGWRRQVVERKREEL